MKKTILFLLTVALFCSCSDDDDTPKPFSLSGKKQIQFQFTPTEKTTLGFYIIGEGIIIDYDNGERDTIFGDKYEYRTYSNDSLNKTYTITIETEHLTRLRITTHNESNKPTLSNLKVGSCPLLNQLTFIAGIKDDSLDLRGCTQLGSLWVHENHNLNYIDVSNCKGLINLFITNNKLKSLNLRNNPYLSFLNCNFNELTNIDLRNNSDLEALNCNFNKLTSIDLPNNLSNNFRGLYCSENKLSAETLNNIFRKLPREGGMINYLDNPGTDTCDKSIYEAKGWSGSFNYIPN